MSDAITEISSACEAFVVKESAPSSAGILTSFISKFCFPTQIILIFFALC